LVQDAFGLSSSHSNHENTEEEMLDGEKDESAETSDHNVEDIPYKKLLEQCDEELYPGFVIHIEKNVFDNLIGTLLNLDGKTKDNENARKDLMEIGIRHELDLVNRPNKKSYMPLTCYTMTNVEKYNFLQVLKDLKVPDGYSSNISRGRIRQNGVSSGVDFVRVEKLFPPSFFIIMVHLTIHLISEAKLGGPVHYRWMYLIKRCLMRLKSYFRNKPQPEGSMAEGYVKDECLTFCSRYVEGVETLFNRPPRNDKTIYEKEIYMLNSRGRKLGKVDILELDYTSLAQAHRYVLLNHDLKTIEKLVVEEFLGWLQLQVSFLEQNNFNKEVLSFAIGPSNVAKQCTGFIMNGLRFFTKCHEEFKKTQNSGVMVEVEGGNYYGKLTSIIGLEYVFGYKVVLFHSD
nr:hypothetical protein [Tanacetum cinerariifolium]